MKCPICHEKMHEAARGYTCDGRQGVPMHRVVKVKYPHCKHCHALVKEGRQMCHNCGKHPFQSSAKRKLGKRI